RRPNRAALRPRSGRVLEWRARLVLLFRLPGRFDPHGAAAFLPRTARERKLRDRAGFRARTRPARGASHSCGQSRVQRAALRAKSGMSRIVLALLALLCPLGASAQSALERYEAGD